MKDKVFSRITMTLLLALTANAGFANVGYKDTPIYKDMLPCPSLKGGFYVGAQTGYEAYRVKQTLTFQGGSFSTTASLTGWLGGLFLGYGYYFNNLFYLGAEVLANYNGADQVFASGADDDGDSFSRRLRADGTWGIVVVPGVKLNDATLGYIRLGYDWTRFKHTATAVNDGGPAISISDHATLGGFDFGIGLETVVWDCLSVRTQYDHIWYNSKSREPVAGVTTTVKPSNNQFTVGLLYHFL